MIVRSRLAFIVGLLATFPTSMVGQDRLIGDAIVAIEPTAQSWRFGAPLTSDSIAIRRVSQMVMPLSIALRGRGVTIDASAAYAQGRVDLADGRTLKLDGFTDVRVRAVASIAGDNVLLTLGATGPTGRVRLAGDQVEALGVLGAPSLAFAAPFLGNGFGANGGLVIAWRIGPWAVGVGSSVEWRARYTPIDALIAGASIPTDLKPGLGYHGSLGIDRVIGSGRLSLLFAGDYFTSSGVFIASPGGPEVESRFRLGPQYSGTLGMEFGVPGFRTFSLTISDRYRTSFTGFDGTVAPGSSGNHADARLEIVTGASSKPGLLIRVEGLLDSGLRTDNSITTAAMTAGGLTLGAVLPVGRFLIQPYAQARAGRIDTGPQETTAKGIGGGLVLVLRSRR